MAKIELTAVQMGREGNSISPMTSWNADGFYFSNPSGQKTFIAAKSTHSAEQTISFNIYPSQTIDGETPPDKNAEVAAGDTTLIGPFPQKWYNDASNRVQVAAAALTGVSVKLFKVVEE